MADDDAGARQWIVEPPGANEITFHMSFGEDVELTADQERALSEFIESLERGDAEVTGHTTGPCYWNCTDHGCDPVKCGGFHCTNLCATHKTTISASTGSSWSLMGSFSRGI